MPNRRKPAPESASNMRLQVYLNFFKITGGFKARQTARTSIRKLEDSITQFVKTESTPHKYERNQEDLTSREIRPYMIKSFLWHCIAGIRDPKQRRKSRRYVVKRNELIQYLLHGNGMGYSKSQQYMTLPQAVDMAHEWLVIVKVEDNLSSTKAAMRKSYQRHIPGQLPGYPRSVFQGVAKDENGKPIPKFNFDKDFVESCKWPLRNGYFKKQTKNEILGLN